MESFEICILKLIKIKNCVFLDRTVEVETFMAILVDSKDIYIYCMIKFIVYKSSIRNKPYPSFMLPPLDITGKKCRNIT